MTLWTLFLVSITSPLKMSEISPIQQHVEQIATVMMDLFAMKVKANAIRVRKTATVTQDTIAQKMATARGSRDKMRILWNKIAMAKMQDSAWVALRQSKKRELESSPPYKQRRKYVPSPSSSNLSADLVLNYVSKGNLAIKVDKIENSLWLISYFFHVNCVPRYMKQNPHAKFGYNFMDPADITTPKFLFLFEPVIFKVITKRFSWSTKLCFKTFLMTGRKGIKF